MAGWGGGSVSVSRHLLERVPLCWPGTRCEGALTSRTSCAHLAHRIPAPNHPTLGATVCGGLEGEHAAAAVSGTSVSLSSGEPQQAVGLRDGK